jgi:adenylate cyclase
MREGIAAHRLAQTWQNEATFLILLAEAQTAAGRSAEALLTLQDAEVAMARTGERYYEPGLHHLRGRVLERQSSEQSLAEASYVRAIDVAREQRAKSWELRAATSLARVWQRGGRTAEAASMLGEIYHWFVEGLDRPDLQAARTLLDELASPQ